MTKQVTKTLYLFGELLKLAEDGKVTNKAVDRARQWLQAKATTHDWYEFEYEFWTEALSQIGFEDAEISFCGFSSQGDGASFTSSIDLDKLIDFLATEIKPTGSCKEEDCRPYLVKLIDGKPTNPKYRHLKGVINFVTEAKVERTSSHYVHERTCEAKLDLNTRGEFLDGVIPGGKYMEWMRSTWVSEHPKVEALFNEFEQDVETLRLDLCHAIYQGLDETYEFMTDDPQLVEDSKVNEDYFDSSGNREDPDD